MVLSQVVQNLVTEAVFSLSDAKQLGEDKVSLERLLGFEGVEFCELACEGVGVLGLGYLCD